MIHSDKCVSSSQAGQVMCRRMVCDCDNPNADLFCCPECDPRLSSQCLHQNGLLTYGSGDTWVENCQQCQCLVSRGDKINTHTQLLYEIYVTGIQSTLLFGVSYCESENKTRAFIPMPTREIREILQSPWKCVCVRDELCKESQGERICGKRREVIKR